jgi:hypothetical protein
VLFRSDQFAIQHLIRKSKVISRKGPTVLLNISHLVDSRNANRPFVRYSYDPVYVQHGDMMSWLPKYYAWLAGQRNISLPYVCHLAWVLPGDKIGFFKARGLWFLASDNLRCEKPGMQFYRNWKNVNKNIKTSINSSHY